MKFLKALGLIIVAFLLFSWLVGSYLSPDDLSDCEVYPTETKGCGVADAIVAISGGDTTARADEAIALYKNGWASKIIFSGAAADKTGPSNAAVMKQRAIDSGVPITAVVLEDRSETTAENASETADIFDQHKIKSAILVTSAYHQRRAGLEFDKRAGGIEMRRHPVAVDKHWGPYWWLTPTGWSLAMPEFVRSLILSAGGIDQR